MKTIIQSTFQKQRPPLQSKRAQLSNERMYEIKEKAEYTSLLFHIICLMLQ
ncbi:hypothetical protein QY97_00126 [Bacillus thermotolerans]|uniref:Uncharacterized protein n=1 Tax=Bacillus thermotolerans TaxID=1221996 RepID=A0A0F5I0Q2_BACTR|nr:hypothetical protein QY97_00126 [Bacillus thermotolerans]KKB42239.1 hypothetical protein QY95_00088 [Bacillus thermotolerans]